MKDIVFVTYLQTPRDTGQSSVYDKVRLKLNGQTATVQVLRSLVNKATPPRGASSTPVKSGFRLPAVLTPFYMDDFMTRRGLSFQEITCFELEVEILAGLLKERVGLIALCTTWLPSVGGAALVRKVASQIKGMAPGVPIIAGGVGVRKGLRIRGLLDSGELSGFSRSDLVRDYLGLDAQADQGIDALVASEGGEATLARVAHMIKSNQEYRTVPNLILIEPEGYRSTASEPESSDIDGELIDWTRHIGRLEQLETPIRTAVGCPFRCEFCDFTKLYTSRLRSLESLAKELHTLTPSDSGPRRVFFADDNIAINRKRILGFTRMLVQERLKISWRSFIRADSIDEETADLIKESGCRECLLGIESGSPLILRNMNKKLEPEKALRAIELLNERGIDTQATFIVGFPGESRDTIRETAAFISSFPSGESARAIHRYYLFEFQPLPLCPAMGPVSRERFGLKVDGLKWSHNTMDSEEAALAVQEIFMKVQGISHMYLELLPADWSPENIRRVLEIRDSLQKARVKKIDTKEIERQLYREVMAGEGLDVGQLDDLALPTL